MSPQCGYFQNYSDLRGQTAPNYRENRVGRGKSEALKLDRIKNETIRGTPKVGAISKKVRKVVWSGMGEY